MEVDLATEVVIDLLTFLWGDVGCGFGAFIEELLEQRVWVSLLQVLLH